MAGSRFCVVCLALAGVVWLTVACGSGTPSPGAQPASGPLVSQELRRPRIVAFGDGVTGGTGLAEGQAYPSVIQRYLDESGYEYDIASFGEVGETTASAIDRVEGILDDDVPILILAVGAEDARRGVPAESVKRNLSRIIEHARQRGIGVLLVGAEAPPDFGPDYVTAFRQLFVELAREFGLVVVPALLEGVTGRRELLQTDGVTPNADGARVVADQVWRALQPMVDNLGGEGLFFAAMSGPGRVWLQTLPFSRLADRIHHAYRRHIEDTKRDFGGMLGGLGDLIGGDRR